MLDKNKGWYPPTCILTPSAPKDAHVLYDPLERKMLWNGELILWLISRYTKPTIEIGWVKQESFHIEY